MFITLGADNEKTDRFINKDVEKKSIYKQILLRTMHW